VDHDVVLEGRRSLEGLLACGAHVWSVDGTLLVVALVVQPLEAVVKSLAAVLAHVGQLPAMLNPHVQIEQVLGELHAVALLALELLGALVPSEVHIEVALLAKSFAALVAEI